MKKLIVVAVLGVIGWVSEQDYQDAVAEQERQCQMIKEGVWPAEVNPNCPSKTEVVTYERYSY